MASIHSDDVDGGSIDTAASRKGVDQHKQELLVLEQQLAEKHNKEIQNCSKASNSYLIFLFNVFYPGLVLCL
jgi:hypothetical protein